MSTPTEPAPDPSGNVADSVAGHPSSQLIGSAKPRVWPLFLASLVELAFASVVQGVAAIAMVLAQTLYGVGLAKYVLGVELVLHLLVVSPVAGTTRDAIDTVVSNRELQPRWQRQLKDAGVRVVLA